MSDIDKLICSIAEGDMEALETLYNELAPVVYAFARSITHSHSIAQDIMQDTFLRVYNSASKFTSKGYGKAWIMQITRNMSLNFLSSRSRYEPVDLIEDEPDINTTEDIVEARTLLRDAIDSLPDSEREVVVLHAVSGLRLAEISRILDVPIGTVKWRHAAALKRIRESVGGYV